MNTNNANKQNIYKDKKTTHWAGKKKEYLFTKTFNSETK